MYNVTNEHNETVRFSIHGDPRLPNYREAAIKAHRLMGGKVLRVAIDGEPEEFPIRFFSHEDGVTRFLRDGEWAFELIRQLHSRYAKLIK